MVHHITAAASIDAGPESGDAFAGTGPDTLVVDADAFLIAEGLGFGANLEGSWTVIINGTVETFGSSFSGLAYSFGSNSNALKLTVGKAGDIFGPDRGIIFNSALVGSTIANRGTISGGTGIVVGGPLSINNEGTVHGSGVGIDIGLAALTLVNSGTVSGSSFSIRGDIAFPASAHLTNFGTLQGNVLLCTGDDVFNDFKKVRHVIKNGTVNGSIDLGDGADHFNGGSHSETVRDGGGADTYKLGGGSDIYLAVKAGGASDESDNIDGGTGSDTYIVASAAVSSVSINLDTKSHDLTPIAPGVGLVAANTATGSDVGTDHITGFENATGGVGGDLIYGSTAANVLKGGGGGDNLLGLAGNDTLIGEAGPDGLAGGPGRDVLTGGSEADAFQFFSIKDSGITAATRDVITDFEQTIDHIDVHFIDIKSAVSGAFIGTQSFHHLAGEYRESYSGGSTIVSGDLNGDGKSDFSVALIGHFLLQGGDFTF